MLIIIDGPLSLRPPHPWYKKIGPSDLSLSVEVFAVDKNDWKILFSEVPGKLKSLHKDGYKAGLCSVPSSTKQNKVNNSFQFLVSTDIFHYIKVLSVVLV